MYGFTDTFPRLNSGGYSDLSRHSACILRVIMLVSIGLLLWNFVSFLPKIPMSPATYILLGGGSKEIIHPLDLQINYATAYMLIREGHPGIYDYRTMQHVGHTLHLYPDLFFYPPREIPVFTRYVSTPLAIFAYLPLVFFPFGVAYRIWTAATAVFLAATLIILLKGKSLPFTAAALLAAAFFIPVQSDLMFGQMSTLMLFLFTAFFFAMQKERLWAGAALLAVLIHMKVLPIIFILFFLKKRAFKVLLLSTLFVGLLCVFPYALLGSQPLVHFVKVVAPSISGGNYHMVNQSLYAFVGRLFYMHDGVSLTDGLDGMLDFRAALVSKAFSLAIIVLLWLLTTKEYEPSRLLSSNEVSLYLLTMLLISPVAWFHYFTVTLIPLFTLLGDITRQGKKEFGTVIAFAVCFSMINFFPLYNSKVLVDLKFFALAVLWVVFAFRLWKERQNHSNPVNEVKRRIVHA